MFRHVVTLIDTSKIWFAEDAPNWIFAVKTSAAGLLALWIAFRLDFSQPQWALMTVFIVARKESGLIITKSFYRILGTLFGCGMALILASLFSQSAELFLLSLALWIGLTVALAARYRNFQSYGFMLAGYTAAIVGFGAAAVPHQAFDIAMSRVSEVVVGILCAGVVAEVFFPVHASKRLIPDALARFKLFTGFIAHAFALDMDSSRMQQVQQGFLTDLVASETNRSSSLLEGPNSRLLDARHRWMNASFMKISSTLHGFIQTMRRFRADASTQTITIVTHHYHELIECLQGDGSIEDDQAATIATRLKNYRAGLPQQHAQIEARVISIDNSNERHDAAAALSLYIRVVDELADYVTAVAELSSRQTAKPPSVPSFAVHGDSWIALLSGLRSIGVLFVLSGFWIASAWPGGSGAAILGAVFCILFGTLPSPLVVLKRVAVGFVVGQVMAFICLFMVLPVADGYISMAIGLLPFLVLCAWLIEHKRYGVEGSGVFLAFLAALAPRNQMNYDIVGFLNDGIGTFVGLGAAGIAFSLMPASAIRLRNRLLASLGRQAGQACLAPLQQGRLRHHFESRTRDLLYQLSTPPANIHGDAGDAIGNAMSILEIGQIVIEMRLVMDAISKANKLKEPMNRLLRHIAALCQQPCNERRAPVVESLNLLEIALDEFIASNDADANRIDQLQMGRYQIRAILRDDDWFRLVSSMHLSRNTSAGVGYVA